MKTLFSVLYVRCSSLQDDCGQDLIEYSLVVGLIALATTAGMTDVAVGVNQAFNNVAGKLGQYTP